MIPRISDIRFALYTTILPSWLKGFPSKSTFGSHSCQFGIMAKTKASVLDQGRKSALKTTKHNHKPGQKDKKSKSGEKGEGKTPAVAKKAAEKKAAAASAGKVDKPKPEKERNDKPSKADDKLLDKDSAKKIQDKVLKLATDANDKKQKKRSKETQKEQKEAENEKNEQNKQRKKSLEEKEAEKKNKQDEDQNKIAQLQLALAKTSVPAPRTPPTKRLRMKSPSESSTKTDASAWQYDSNISNQERAKRYFEQARRELGEAMKEAEDDAEMDAAGMLEYFTDLKEQAKTRSDLKQKNASNRASLRLTEDVKEREDDKTEAVEGNDHDEASGSEANSEEGEEEDPEEDLEEDCEVEEAEKEEGGSSDEDDDASSQLSRDSFLDGLMEDAKANAKLKPDDKDKQSSSASEEEQNEEEDEPAQDEEEDPKASGQEEEEETQKNLSQAVENTVRNSN